MIEWPIDLAQAIQRAFIQENITDPEPLLDVFKSQKELLTSDLFGILLPQQPGLLAFLTLLGITTAVFFVLFLVFCVARCLGGCDTELYQVNNQEKYTANRSTFFGLTAGFCVSWFLTAFSIIFVISCILHLSGGRGNVATVDDVSVDFRPLNKTAFRPVKIGLQSISISNFGRADRAPVGEADLLNKYNSIRELSYEFRPLPKDADFRTQVVIFSVITFIFTALLAVSGTTVILGCREFLYSYHPMDRSNSSNCCGRTLIATTFTLLASIPLLLLVSGVLLSYVQAHNSLCPFVQAQSQNHNIEEFVNSNFEIFDSYNLLDFLNDLQSEREEINKFNCENYSRPLQGIWFALIFLVVMALPMAFVILRLSKYFLRMKPQIYWNPAAETYTLQREKNSVQNSSYHSVFPRY